MRIANFQNYLNNLIEQISPDELKFNKVYKPYFTTISLFGAILASIGIAYVLSEISPFLALLSVIAIPFAIYLLFRPEMGLLVIIFILPLEIINDFGSISLTKVLSVLVFGAAAMHYIIFDRQKPLVKSPQNLFILVFILVALFSVVVAISPERTLERITKLLRVAALYYFLINFIRKKDQLNWAIWLFVIGGVFSTVYGFIDPAQSGQRFYGALGQPNLYALSIAARLPVLLALFQIEKGFVKKAVLVFMFILMAYGVILSGSRGGLLALVLSLILFAITQEKRGVWMSIIVVIFFVGVITMPESIKERVGFGVAGTSENSGNSTDRRETYLIFGQDLVKENPLFGIGLDGFAEAYAQSDYRFLQKDQTLRLAHNTYLEIMVGTGILGFIPFLAMLIYPLSLMWNYSTGKYEQASKKIVLLASGIFSALGGYYFGIIFGSRQYEKTLWFLLAIPIIIDAIAKTSQKNISDHVNGLPS